MTRTMPTEAEIAVLEALAEQGERLTAKLAGAPQFRAPFLFVDPGRQYLVLGECGDPAADSALLGLPRADFAVEWGEWRIAFTAGEPAPCKHEGKAAIRVRFPESVAINRRRMHERAPVPESASLRCVAYSGAAPIFDAAVTDVGHGGIGIQFDAAGDALVPGMVIARCRLEKAGHTTAIVDLEVRHTATSVFPDGRRMTRAGCRFANLSPEAMKLVAEFSRA